jgi:hypothetical protein
MTPEIIQFVAYMAAGMVVLWMERTRRKLRQAHVQSLKDLIERLQEQASLQKRHIEELKETQKEEGRYAGTKGQPPPLVEREVKCVMCYMLKGYTSMCTCPEPADMKNCKALNFGKDAPVGFATSRSTGKACTPVAEQQETRDSIIGGKDAPVNPGNIPEDQDE